MQGLYLYKIKLFSFFVVMLLGFSSYAQSQTRQNNYIDNKLVKIDSLIKLKQYDKAVILIKNTQDTFFFKSYDEKKLALDYRYALVLYQSGEQEEALEKFLIGFGKIKKNPTSPLYFKYISFLTKIFIRSRNIEKSFYYNKIALKNAYINKDTSGITLALNRMGVLYLAKNELDSAKHFHRQVIHRFPITSKTEDRHAIAYNNLGVIAEKNNNFPLAYYYAQKTFEVKKRQMDSIGMAYTILNLGNIYFYRKDYEKAIKNYLEVMTLLKDSTEEAMVIKKNSYDNLAISYDSLGDYKKAYNYLLNFRHLNKEINESILDNKFTETEAKYNLAREEQKTEVERNKALRSQFLFYGLAFITLTFFILIFIFYKNYKLRQQNKLEQVQNDMQTRIINATIDAKEKERKNIAEILHDSVSALLSSANLHLQASKAQLNAKAPIEITKAQQIVEEASVKIRDLSHNLISSVLLKFGLAFAVNDLCEKYSNSKFNLISDDNGIKRYNQNFEIKIYNIIEELINNIIKHSKAKNASIILIERNGDKLIIQIIDDGIGFDVKKAINKNGLGLSHIEARIKVMKGVFNINSKKGEGTSIFISTPIYESRMVENI